MIDQDHGRFRSIIKGRIKKELQKYVSHGEMLVRKGKDKVAIQMPSIDIPRFRFSSGETIGQGPGDVGEELGPAQAGEKAQEHELSLPELAALLGEELALPAIEPRGKKTIQSHADRYTSVAHQGPASLRHLRRTFRETLRRQSAQGESPIFIPIKKDMRYRSWKTETLYENAAVIIYIMDVSGSMGDAQKEIVRTEAFWIDTWLRSQYKGLETRYIVHDADAREVDEETFFRTKESGGTLISSAYKLCEKIIHDHYSPNEWNIYPFHFSDGDNWSRDDTKISIEILEKSILPQVNQFCYGQVDSPHGTGEFHKDLLGHFGDKNTSLSMSRIRDKEDIYQSIKDFLGKGK